MAEDMSIKSTTFGNKGIICHRPKIEKSSDNAVINTTETFTKQPEDEVKAIGHPPMCYLAGKPQVKDPPVKVKEALDEVTAKGILPDDLAEQARENIKTPEKEIIGLNLEGKDLGKIKEIHVHQYIDTVEAGQSLVGLKIDSL